MPIYDDAARSVDDLIKRLDDGKSIRAYHGSPYDFDRFDSSKIGTGEGAQSYGHGLYFAGVEDVAKGYRDATKWQGVDKSTPAMRASLFAHSKGDGSAESAIRAMENAMAESYFGGAGRSAQLNKAAIEYLRAGGEIPPPPVGRMYEVQIEHPESALLDLNAPVGSQPREIQDALGEFAEAPKWFSMGQDGWNGKNAYTRMASVMADKNPRIVGGYHITHDMPSASEALRRSGVPGVRYLDQGSRSSGAGTRNYVMFPGTEDSITILRKYGLLPPLAGAAAMQGDDQP